MFRLRQQIASRSRPSLHDESVRLRAASKDSGASKSTQRRDDAPHPLSAGILESTTVTPDGRTHVRFPRRHVELAEQLQQCRMGAVAVHDEPGVDLDSTLRSVDLVCVRATAESCIRLEQRDVGGLRQHISRRQPGDSASDHRHRPTCHCPTPVFRDPTQCRDSFIRAVSRTALVTVRTHMRGRRIMK